jgi:hypothetical protein
MIARGAPSLSAHVGRDDREGRGVELRAEVLEQHGHREQVVDGPVEEALDLRGVQVDAHDAVGAGGLEQVGDETGRDRLAAAPLLVLPRVRVEGRDDGDALGRGALEGVDHDELLHERLVDGARVRLDDERVAAAHALVEARVDLAVGEGARVGGQHLGLELGRDLLGELGVGAPRDDNEALLAGDLDAGHESSVSAAAATIGVVLLVRRG